MKYFRIITLVVIVFFSFHHALYAQPVASASKLKISTKLSVDKVTAGSTFKAAVQITIADGWHVNSNTPASDYLIGTKFELDQKEDCTFSNLTYPQGKNIKFAFSEEPLSVYEKEIKIFFTVKLSETAKPRRDSIKATLTIQACNDQVCLAPSEIEVKIPVTVVGAKGKSKSINDNIFPSYKPSDSKKNNTPHFRDNSYQLKMTESLRTHKKPNRLINEKSPYLLQHAYNPVDWYPWGNEAFNKAKREDKPIFLSIGYSTCYWCHVMEREVFENESLAALMNKYVVSIKVDREERPDIDRVYMTALQAMSGSGGWPMSMFLDTNRKPFFGATYIPPVSQHGQAGFKEVLERINEVWMNDRPQIDQVTERMNDYLHQVAHPETAPIHLGPEILDGGFDSFLKIYDTKNAGFGGAPKFPRPTVFNFLLRYYKRTGNQRSLEMTLETLQRMARSGMCDHIGGGFHRYATDERWHVPHFEKMLYDQAQLAISYLEAFQLTHDAFYSDAARNVLAYVERVLSHPDGGFYSAEDAESAPDAHNPTKKEEGAFYVWTKNELSRILSEKECLIFCRYYDVQNDGNVLADPQGAFKGKNILHKVHSVEELAKQCNASSEEIEHTLKHATEKIFKARENRPRPHLDDKILVSWNGMMISACARAYQVLGDKQYLQIAERAANFILDKLADRNSGQLLRRYRDGEARFEAHLEDYAFLIQALIDLYEASSDIEHLKTALTFTERQNQLFYDQEQGGFFDISGNDKTILIRTKEWYDGAEPTGNSIAILNLLRLSHMTNNQAYAEMATETLGFFSERLSNMPNATPQFLTALDFSLSKPKQIVIAGNPNGPLTKQLLEEIHSRFIPNKIILFADESEGQKVLASLVPFLESIHPIGGKPTAYICENYACQLPTSDSATLGRLLSR
ncbi:MAG: DUF255 domain-containing protein [Ignavibacteriales bacterium]|nr:DUF255 domain-containing protein [Ignavibacteriales bacterium]